MYNPFDNIEERFRKIENDFLAQNHNKAPEPTLLIPDFKYYPILNLFEKKICSKPTFYKYLKEGRYDLYKFGDRSFVELAEFYAAFRKITFKNKKHVRSPSG